MVLLLTLLYCTVESFYMTGNFLLKYCKQNQEATFLTRPHRSGDNLMNRFSNLVHPPIPDPVVDKLESHETMFL